MGYLSEILSCMDIGNMDFDHRCLNSRDRITDGYGCMCITTRVKNNTIILKADTLEFIDQLTFYIALIIEQVNVGVLVLQVTKENVKWLVAVNIDLSFTKKVEIGTVDYRDLHVPNVMNF